MDSEVPKGNRLTYILSAGSFGDGVYVCDLAGELTPDSRFRVYLDVFERVKRRKATVLVVNKGFATISKNHRDGNEDWFDDAIASGLRAAGIEALVLQRGHHDDVSVRLIEAAQRIGTKAVMADPPTTALR